MANAKVTALDQATTIAGTDVLYVVTTPGGTPASKKATLSSLLTGSSSTNLTSTAIPKATAGGLLADSAITMVANGTGTAMTFGSLGTSTIAIDLSATGLSGATDYPLYVSSTCFIDANGRFVAAIGSTGGFQFTGADSGWFGHTGNNQLMVFYTTGGSSGIEFRPSSTTISALKIVGNGTVTKKANMSTVAGGIQFYCLEATATLSGASTDIAIGCSAGWRILATQLRVDTLVTSGDGATSWSAAYSGGSTQAIASGQAFAKNTKANKHYDPNAASDVMGSTTNITITPNAGTFSGGVIRAFTFVEIIEAVSSAA